MMEQLKMNWKIPFLFALSVLVLAFMFFPFQANQVAATEPAELNTITVSGKGEMSVSPDVAYIQFGLNTQGKSAEEAQVANAKIFAKINEVVKAKGLSGQDIQTVQFNTYPRYDWENEKNVFKGYQVEHILQVTYRDMDRIGLFLDAVTAAGVNRIHHIQFGTEKTDEYELAVLEKAMENAEKKAAVLAKKAGKQVKAIIHIQEEGTTARPIYRQFEAEESAKMMATDAQTSVSQGSLKIQKQIQVVFEF
jgi:uncharacterized protein YggE